MTFSKPLGGYVNDVVSMRCEEEGGDAGGVSSWREEGRGPGEQMGMCLLGTAAGVPRCEVLIESAGGGVAVRVCMAAGAAATIVAITLVTSRILSFNDQWRCRSLRKRC